MDFEKFYNKQGDYESFRNDPGKREEYNITVDWKARQLEKLVPVSKRFNNILEVGCAMGILLQNLSSRLSITERTGLDISSENIRVAKELHPDIHFFQGIIEDLNKGISDNQNAAKFDLVLLSDIVEHIPDDAGFLKQVRDISSYVLLNLPLEKCFISRNRKYGETDPSGHLRSYNEALAVNLIKESGFEIVDSFISNAFSDKTYRDMYRKKRSMRLEKKPFFLRYFWEIYYLFEDSLKLANKSLSVKIFGTNYFALLRSHSV